MSARQLKMNIALNFMAFTGAVIAGMLLVILLGKWLWH